MKIKGIILRKGVDGKARVFVDSDAGEVEIISSYAEDTLIDHWVNWSTVKELLNEQPQPSNNTGGENV